MERRSYDLDHLLDEPFVQVLPNGKTLRMNRAFRELAKSYDVDAELASIFGPSVQDLLSEADTNGRANAYLPALAAPAPGRTFRILLKSSAPGESISALVMDVSDEVAWRRQLFDRSHDFRVLNAIGAALSGTVEQDVLALRILEQTRRIIPTTHFRIALLDQEAKAFSFPVYVEDGVLRRIPPHPLANGISEYVLRTRRPLLLSGDVRARAQELGIEPVAAAPAAWLGAPMLAGEDALGVIAIQDFEDASAFDQHNLEVLTIIAGQAAAAIRNTRLLAEARAAYQELSQAQGRLLETERLRGVTETVGALNHEVNNPLAAIVGNAQLLLRESEELSQRLRPKIESILESARRIQRVTGRMATLIQASSMPYPGRDAILDVERSLSIGEPRPAKAGDDVPDAEPGTPPGAARAA
jgi:GAF domain-containing protein